MKRLLYLLCLLATPALGQGYLNPPIYATGYISAPAGTNTTTNIRQAANPNNLNILNAGPISAWNVVMPSPPFDGQIMTVGCPGGDVAVLNVMTNDGTTIGAGGNTSCTAASLSPVVYQYQAQSKTWLPIVNTTGGGPVGVPWALTDGTHTVTSVGQVTVTGATVGGTTPNATLTVPAPTPPLTLTDGTHTVANVDDISVTGATVGGTSPNATLTVNPNLTVDDTVPNTVTAVTHITYSGAVVSGSAGHATVTITPPASVTSVIPVVWDSNTPVANATIPLITGEWSLGTVTGFTYFTGGTSTPSFTATIKKNGTTMTGCNAITVSSATPATATCTALNTFTYGDELSLVIASVSGTPFQAKIQPIITTTLN